MSSRVWQGIREWIAPGRVDRPTVPPLEGGLRPNTRLDGATTLVSDEAFALDDVVVRGDDVLVSRGDHVAMVGPDGHLSAFAKLPGPCGPMTVDGDRLVVAVDGHGLFSVDRAGAQELLSDDEQVRQCVTDLCRLADGSLLVAVGSTRWPLERWSDALLDRDRAGLLLRLRDGVVEVVASGLRWPSGVAPGPDGGVVVSESLGHQVSAGPLGGRWTPILRNLPCYPGRLRASSRGGWWVTAPYVRNRLTELLLTEPEVIRDMRATIEPDLWIVPRLGSRNPIREPLQHGQRRVLGQLRPWAPPWSYGLVFHVNTAGLVTESLHSRTDGRVHGLTGICPRPGALLLVAKGAGELIQAEVAP